MRKTLFKLWLVFVVFGPALLGSTVAEMAFHRHHVLSAIFMVAFGFGGLYIGMRFGESISGEKLL